MKIIIPPSAIEEHYAVLSHIGNLGQSSSEGFLRAAYSDEETEAMRHFEILAIKTGFKVRWDAIRNLYIEIEGQTEKFVETGSHLDTVPMGGNFDGAAGVVAGFEALKHLSLHISSMKRGVRLRIWRAEESATFGVSLCGSSGAFGKLDKKNLQRSFQNKSLEDAMKRQRVDISTILEQKPTITQAEINNIAAHIELHIEQGNFLEVSKKDIGIVTGIRGPRRIRVALTGEFDHSGATPMGVEFRRDVNLALAHILTRLDTLAHEKLREGADLVQTIGVINSDSNFNATHEEVYQNAITKVSGYCYFTLEVRSINNEFRDQYCQKIEELIKDVSQQLRVSATIEVIGSSLAIESLNSNIQEVSSRSCEELGYSHEKMPSGATHDCANVAQQKKSSGSCVPVGMLFIPCRGGKSHSPDEYASYEAIAKGSSILAQTLYQLAND